MYTYNEYDLGEIIEAGKASPGDSSQPAEAAFETRKVEWVTVEVGLIEDIPKTNEQYEFRSSLQGDGDIHGYVERVEYIGNSIFKVFLDQGSITRTGTEDFPSQSKEEY